MNEFDIGNFGVFVSQKCNWLCDSRRFSY